MWPSQVQRGAKSSKILKGKFRLVNNFGIHPLCKSLQTLTKPSI